MHFLYFERILGDAQPAFFSGFKDVFSKAGEKDSAFVLYFCRGGVLVFSFASTLSFVEFFTNSETYKSIFWNCVFLNFMHSTLPGCFGENLAAVNGTLWTIKIELTFYVLLPALIWLLKKLKNFRQVNAALLVLYALSVLYAFLMQRYAAALHLPHQLANQFPAFVCCFVSGMFCLFNWEWILQKLNLLILPCVVLFVLHYFAETEFLMSTVLAVICVFFAMKFTFLSSVAGKTDYSYPLYLFHFPLIQLMAHFRFYDSSFPLAFFLTFAGTFLISVFATKLLNERSVSAGRGGEALPKRSVGMSVSEPQT